MTSVKDCVRLGVRGAVALALGVGSLLAVTAVTTGPAGASSPSWSIVASPNTSSSQSNFLNGVSCVSSTSCVAVGSDYNGSVDHTLIESWNGASWSIVASPNTSSSQSNYLNGVSCVSSTSCIAVGTYYNGSVDQTLVESWNGTSWSIVASPNTSSSQYNYLNSVSCVSSNSCTAVGNYSNSQTLVESWNGTSWSIVASPNVPGSQYNYLNGVSCVSSTSCIAVGSHYGTSVQTLIESWNGTSWSIVASPSVPGSVHDLAGISCLGSTSCTAVGFSGNATLIETGTSAPTAGYYEVASDGGIFSFGPGATFYGSMGGKALNKPIVGIAAVPGGNGYYEVASDGGIFSFGPGATFYGSMGGQPLNKPIVGIAASPSAGG